ncbi:MAG: hypothetical protein AB1435_14240 [Chloroflexota bacterium]|jgi:hypothetical protein
MLREYEGNPLHAQAEGPENYELVGPPTARSQGKPVWFGAVRLGKRYVSYHLMAVYAFPDLLDDVSPQLKARMQGKSCFNFTRVDEELFRELAALTQKCFERFKAEGLLE